MKKILIISLFALSFSTSCEGEVAIYGTSAEGLLENEKEKGAKLPGTPDDPIEEAVDDDLTESQLVRISRAEYENSVHSIFGSEIIVEKATLPIDERLIGLFDSNEGDGANGQEVEAYWTAAENIADQINVDQLCEVSQSIENCMDSILGRYAARITKRKTSDETMARFRDFATKSIEEGNSREDTLKSVIVALLNLPEFLYHTEPVSIEDGVEKVDGYVVARRLASFLWLETPDDLLLEAAESGELDNKEGIEKHTRRMLAHEKADRVIKAFHTQWLGVDSLAGMTVDNELYPEFEGLKPAMQTELEVFTTKVVREGTFSELINGQYSYIDDQLATFYGLPESGLQSDFQRMDDIPNRAGILTQAAVLASSGKQSYVQPIFRGLFFLNNVLCAHVAEPVDLDAIASETEKAEEAFTEEMSDREKLTALTSPANCAYCHQSIDAYGYVAQMYDAIGSHRNLDYNQKEIDSLITLKNQGDLDGEYRSLVELSGALEKSETFKQCYAKQWSRYALGRELSSAQDDGLLFAGKKALESDDIGELIVAITGSYAFSHRRVKEKTSEPYSSFYAREN